MNAKWAWAGIALIATTALLLAGCGSGSTPPAATSSTPGPAPAAPAGEDTLARIKKEGVLKWGADSSGGAPFVFTDPKDAKKIIGFEIEIMDKLAEHMGVKHQIVDVKWENLIPDMLANRSDMVMNGIEINDERIKVVSFSQPYYQYEQQLTVRIEDKDKYKTLDDLKKNKIGTLSGAEANNVLKRAGFADDQVTGHDDSLTPYTNLDLKRVDAVLQESMIAEFYAGQNAKLYNIPQTFSPGKYAVAVRKTDGSLLAEIDKTLDLMKKNGELAAIYKKWKMWDGKQGSVGIVEK